MMAYDTSSKQYAGNIGAAAPVKAVTISSSLEDFDPIIGRLETLANRAMSCGDKIAGSRPSGVAEGAKEPSPNNLISAIHMRRERLLTAVNAIEEEIGLIENGLA